MKQGETIIIKATGQKAVIAFKSSILEENFYYLTINGLPVNDSMGHTKEFYKEDIKAVDTLIEFLDNTPGDTTPKTFEDFTQSEKEAYYLGELHENQRNSALAV